MPKLTHVAGVGPFSFDIYLPKTPTTSIKPKTIKGPYRLSKPNLQEEPNKESRASHVPRYGTYQIMGIEAHSTIQPHPVRYNYYFTPALHYK